MSSRLAGIICTTLVLKQDFNPKVVNNFVAKVAKGFAIPGILIHWELQVKNLGYGQYDKTKTGCSQVRSKTSLSLVLHLNGVYVSLLLQSI